MEFVSYGQFLTPPAKRKKVLKNFISPPQASYRTRPKGTTSINNL